MRFWPLITYGAITVGLIACSVYDSSLISKDDGGPYITASGNADSTTTGNTTSPTTSVTGFGTPSTTNTTSSSGSGGGSGGDVGSGGTGTGGSGEDGTGGSPPTTTDGGGNGGTETVQTTTSTGGTSSSSPTTTGSVATTTGGSNVDPALIDDLEDRNSQLKMPTYDGYWYTAADTMDGDGMVVPAPGDEIEGVTELDEPRDGSAYAMHFSGDWDGGWGAAIGFSFASTDEAIDASSYTGISFWVRTDEAGTEVKLQFLLTGVTDGADYEYLLSDLETLDANWQQMSVHFDDAAQPSWTEDPMSFDPRTLYKIQFQFAEGQGPFDLWIDDIWFLKD